LMPITVELSDLIVVKDKPHEEKVN
jgi:hypothetical protein